MVDAGESLGCFVGEPDERRGNLRPQRHFVAELLARRIRTCRASSTWLPASRVGGSAASVSAELEVGDLRITSRARNTANNASHAKEEDG